MERLKEIVDELSGIAPALGKSGILPHPYTVPQGYFENFAENLLQRIRTFNAGDLQETAGKDTEDLFLINKIKDPERLLLNNNDAVDVPAFMDEENADLEIAALSPLLANLNRKSPYQVPENYFVEFRAKAETPKAKLVPFPSGRRLVRYAVAAAICGIIATTGFFLFHSPAHDPINDLSKMSDQEMLNYMENHDLPPLSAAPSVKANTLDFNDNEISDLLNNVPDSELEQYSPNLSDKQSVLN